MLTELGGTMNAATTARWNTVGSWMAPEVLEPAYVTALCLTDSPDDAEELLARAARRAVSRPTIEGRAAALLRALIIEHGVDLDGFEAGARPAARERSATARAAHRSTGCPEPTLHAAADLDPVTVVAGIRALPPGYRTLAALHCAAEQSYEEVACIVELPLAVVRVRIRQSRSMLHESLALLSAGA